MRVPLALTFDPRYQTLIGSVQTIICVVMVLCGTGLPPATGGVAFAAEGDPVSVAREILSDEAYQTSLPGDPVEDISESIIHPEVEAVERQQDQNDRWWLRLLMWLDDLPGGVIDVMRLLAWVIVGAVGVLLLIALVNGIMRLKWQRQSRAAQVDERPDSRGLAFGSDQSLEEADRLAAQAKWSEAIHLLLMGAIGFLIRTVSVRLSPSLTSREVLRGDVFRDDHREKLSDLVRAVERTRFAERPGDEALYRNCRETFRALVKTEFAP